MNLYFTVVGRPPFNRRVTYCLLYPEAKHAANVFHLRVEEGRVVYAKDGLRLPSRELHSHVGKKFDDWKRALNAIEEVPTRFNERFGLTF